MSQIQVELSNALSAPPGDAEGGVAAEHIFHTPTFARVFSQKDDVELLRLKVLSSGSEVGDINAFLIKASKVLPGWANNRLTVFASPTFASGIEKREVIKSVLDTLDSLSPARCLFAEWRNTEDPSDYHKEFGLHGWEYFPYENYLIDLSHGQEEVWKKMTRSARGNIQKARSKGVTVKVLDSGDWHASYAVIAGLYREKGIPLFQKEVFEDAFKLLLPNGMMRGTFAMFKGKVIGTRLGLFYNGTVFDWFAASDRQFSNCYPNEVLAWDMMEFGATNGFKEFDFGGGGIRGEDYGPARFKEKFRGELVEYGRYRKAFRPSLYRVIHAVYEWRKRFGGG